MMDSIFKIDLWQTHVLIEVNDTYLITLSE